MRIYVPGSSTALGANSIATVGSGSATKLPFVYMPAPSGDTTGATDGAALSACLAALPTTGGVIHFQSGEYFDNQSHDLHNTTGIELRGVGGLSSGAIVGTSLVYTGTAARYLDARSSTAFKIRDLFVLANQSGFTGILVDLSHAVTGGQFDSAFWRLKDSFLGVTDQTAAIVVLLDRAIDGVIDGCYIWKGQYGVVGVQTSGHYSNGIRIFGNAFQNQGSAAILGPGQGWQIEGNVFELTNGNNGIQQNFGSQSGGAITGNWFGDATGSPTVIQAGTGVMIEGNYIAGVAGASIGVQLPVGIVGAVVKGNTLASHSVGISLGSTATDCEIFPNFYTSVTTPYTAPTVTVGAAAGTGGVASITGSDWGGKVSITCGSSGTTTGVLATINLASTHKGHWAVVSPAANGALINIYPSSVTDTTIVVTCGSAPAINATPNFYYMLVPAQ